MEEDRRPVKEGLVTTTGSNCIDLQLFATEPIALKLGPYQSLLGSRLLSSLENCCFYSDSAAGPSTFTFRAT